MTIVISVDNLSKAYHLGQIGTGTFTNDLKLWWAKMRGKPNPLFKIGEIDHGNRDGEDLWALKDVSFTVEQGEVLGIIGRNGAGKSTLLKILSRVTAPTSGRIRVKGRIASLLEVGTGFHPELTGRENIYLNGAILGMSRREIDNKFDEIVDFAEIEKFIDTPVKRYSSGMYVRLAFAVAAHLDPEILIVDEVLAVGDAAFQKKCLGKMGDVAKEGRSVLFVSHNMGAISDLTQRCIYIESGQIKEDDKTEKVVLYYIKASFTEVSGNKLLDSMTGSDISDRNAIFTCIRMINSKNHQTNIIYEKEPITIDVGISLNKAVNSIQFGCGVVRLDSSMELFTAPSKKYQSNFQAGDYQARLKIIPNYLREGMYAINLKLFTEGVRQVVLRNAFQFSILKSIFDKDDQFYQRWLNGPLLFDYKWQRLESIGRK